MKLKSVKSNHPTQVNILNKEKGKWIRRDNDLIEKIHYEAQKQLREIDKRRYEVEKNYHERKKEIFEDFEKAAKESRKNEDRVAYERARDELAKRMNDLRGNYIIATKKLQREQDKVRENMYRQKRAILEFLT
jgi:hypothetical protein